MTGFLKRQTDFVRQYVSTRPGLVAWAKRTLPEVEKFIIAGPTLVGFVFGLVRYQPGSVHFETGFQSLVIFLVYLAALTVLQAAESLFFSGWPIITGVARSLLALLYLALTLRQFMQWRSAAPQILPAVLRLRERLPPLTGDAG